ncbi:MAG TPA: hypothetical protein EYP86_01235 [Candidatus Altiarchaeales archaeon]|nr:hypothetical protein [Candidatus Altiarchaeales archaeon]
MRCRALMITESRDAGSISSSLDIDNLGVEGSENLYIDIKPIDKKRIRTVVKSNKIGTLINTLDDIIRCQIVAENLLAKN